MRNQQLVEQSKCWLDPPAGAHNVDRMIHEHCTKQKRLVYGSSMDAAAVQLLSISWSASHTYCWLNAAAVMLLSVCKQPLICAALLLLLLLP
jgi:hypothetical protein